ncbi:hypothetical protein RB195_003659 [Necator americanus]|uniref:Uncharacterized protein n=1 Tax=Necator americanus TaxID=51031 RepID=A0ABR1DQW6_NECAM
MERIDTGTCGSNAKCMSGNLCKRLRQMLWAVRHRAASRPSYQTGSITGLKLQSYPNEVELSLSCYYLEKLFAEHILNFNYR